MRPAPWIVAPGLAMLLLFLLVPIVPNAIASPPADKSDFERIYDPGIPPAVSVEWSFPTGYNCLDSPPSVADVDADGKPEVVFGAWYGYVYCLDGETGSQN